MSAAIAQRPKQPAPKVADEYVMPKVKMGDRVLWHDSQDSPNDPAMAFVTKVNEQSINVIVFIDGFNSALYRNGVRFIKDPNRDLIARIAKEGDGGVWDYTRDADAPSDARLTVLEDIVQELKLQIATLKK